MDPYAAIANALDRNPQREDSSSASTVTVDSEWLQTKTGGAQLDGASRAVDGNAEHYSKRQSYYSYGTELPSDESHQDSLSRNADVGRSKDFQDLGMTSLKCSSFIL